MERCAERDLRLRQVPPGDCGAGAPRDHRARARKRRGCSARASIPGRARAGRVSESSLVSFTCEQYSILTSDRRSFAQLAARFPAAPAGDLFLAMAEGEG